MLFHVTLGFRIEITTRLRAPSRRIFMLIQMGVIVPAVQELMFTVLVDAFKFLIGFMSNSMGYQFRLKIKALRTVTAFPRGGHMCVLMFT